MRGHLLQILLVAGLSAGASAKSRAAAPNHVPVELQSMAARAGAIFSGRVISVVPVRAVASDRVATVTVTFQVEQAIRGVKAGQMFTFREWAGLWSGGERYRAGQRLLLFLYAPSRLGLTSPVGGDSGRLPVDAQGRVLLGQPRQVPGFAGVAVAPRPPVRVRDVANSIRGMRGE